MSNSKLIKHVWIFERKIYYNNKLVPKGFEHIDMNDLRSDLLVGLQRLKACFFYGTLYDNSIYLIEVELSPTSIIIMLYPKRHHDEACG